jgi:molybdate transport system substrate-binding protein
MAAALSGATAALALAACTFTPDSSGTAVVPPNGSSGAAVEVVKGTVTVFAAASLREGFTRLGAQFEGAHPGTEVVLSFGPSSGLAAQINGGAPADVFASASTTNMDQVVKAGGASRSTTFARNTMQIAVPAANPAGITGVADLARSGVKVAVCQPAVPCGVGAATVFAKAAVSVTPVTHEADVKGVLTKVSLGEADAGLVYVTDVRSAGATVQGVTIPAGLNASTAYPIAALTAAPNAAGARAFTAYVLSPAGARVMAEGGFSGP